MAAVLQCPTDPEAGEPCKCNLKKWNADNVLDHSTNPTHTTLTCITGRQNIPASHVAGWGEPSSEEALLNPLP